MYDPAIGRWTAPDPAGYVDGLDPYEMERDNPVAFVDPMGLQTQPATQPRKSVPSIVFDPYQVHPGSIGQATDYGPNFDANPNGRTYFDGPRYGNWGGKDWSGGQVPSRNNGQMGTKPPVDSSDELYKAHDEAYDAADKAKAIALASCPVGKDGDAARQDAEKAHDAAVAKANRALVDGLLALPAGSSTWPKKPQPDEVSGAERERIMAIYHFNDDSFPPSVKPVRRPSTMPATQP